MKKLENSSSKAWNEKQENYPRFDMDNCEFEKSVIGCAKSWGVDFDDKNIIDIGCGTGKYTILLAKTAKAIDALDFSNKMLDILHTDAKKMKLNHKINMICQDFDEFENNKKYDLAISTMSPAVLSEVQYEKFNLLSDTKVYLGWGGKRESNISNAIFKAHNLTSHTKKASENLKKWLEKNKLKYKSKYFETVWEDKSRLNEALKSEVWHLKLHGITPNIKLIENILSEHIKDGKYIINTKHVRLELIVWEK